MSELEKLEQAKENAFRAYLKLREPTEAAYKKYEIANRAYRDRVLYEKIKRQVMRDLINAATIENASK